MYHRVYHRGGYPGVPRVYHRVYTWLYVSLGYRRVYNRLYTSLGGYSRVYTRLYALPGYSKGVYTRLYAPPYTPLGTPPSAHCTWVYLYLRTPVCQCRERKPWAQTWESCWVEGLPDPQDLRSVTVVMLRMRRLLRSSRVKLDKDWIDIG